MATVKCSMDEVLADENGGCIFCGEIQYGGVEPDAQGYECEACGENAVYGLGELVIRGQIELTDEE